MNDGLVMFNPKSDDDVAPFFLHLIAVCYDFLAFY